MSDETLRLAIGLIILGASLVAIGIGLIMTETAARAAHGLMQRGDRPHDTDAAHPERIR